MNRVLIPFLAVLGCLVFLDPAHGRFFTDVTTSLNLDVPGDVERVSWVDVDGDGDLDLYVSVRGRPDVLFLNNGVVFTRTSLGSLVVGQTGIAWGDFDLDGRLDLFSADTTASGLFRNSGGGVFSNTIAGSGIASAGWRGDAQWIDYDNDLDLDLTLIDTAGVVALYANDGSGGFVDVASSAGIAPGNFAGISWVDVDSDGDLDLFLPGVTSGQANRLYRNTAGILVDNAGTSNLAFSDSLQTGSSWADVDGDGDLDLFMAHTAPASDRLMTNNGSGIFTDVTDAAGVGTTASSVAHGWADYDNDGLIDLFVATPNEPLLYRNQGAGIFGQVAALEGLAATTGIATMAWGDYDGDGDLDLFLAGTDSISSALYRNDSDVANRWLSLSLTGSGGEAGAIGVRATIDVGGIRQLRYVTSQVGRASHHAIDATFGVGPVTVVDSLFLTWPSGDTQTFAQISTNQVLSLSQSDVSPDVRVEVPNVFATSNLIQIPIDISQFLSADSIRSAEIEVSYDGSKLRFEDLAPTQTKTDGWNSVTNVIEGTNNIDTLRVAIFTDALAVTGDGTLLRLTFELLTGTAELSLESVLFNDGTPTVGLLSSGTMRSEGRDANLSVSPDPLGPRESLTITLVDGDANASDAFNDSAAVLATNRSRGDTARVTLRETSPTSGRFVAVLLTDHGTDVTVDDGVLTGIAGDTLEVVWEDLLTAQGLAQTVTVQVQLTGGINGIVLAQPDSISPTDSIQVLVIDQDRDREVSQRDSLFVRIFATANADTESVFLRETDRSSGIFERTFPTRWDSNGVVTSSNDDGFLTVGLRDSIRMEYLDSLAQSGDTTLVRGTAQVVPWRDAELRVSFVVQASSGNSVRDVVRVQVDDADENVRSEEVEVVSARLVNRVSGESEMLDLIETSSNSGRFRARLETVRDTSGTNDDGILSIFGEDSLNVAFYDSLTSVGAPDSVFATTFVVEQFGDIDRNGTIQAFDASLTLEFSVDEALPEAPARPFADFLIADVDGSNTITGFDAALTARFVVGLIQEFPVQTDLVMSPPEDPKNHPFLKPSSSGPPVRFGPPGLDGENLVFSLILTERSQVMSIVADIMIEGGRITGVLAAESYASFMRSGRAHDAGYVFALAGLEATEEGEGTVVRLIVEPDQPERLPYLQLRHLSLNGELLPVPQSVVSNTQLNPPLPYAFRPNFPNPFNPETTVGFDLPDAVQVRIHVYNVLGQLIQTLVDQRYEPGTHTIVWDGRDAGGAGAATGVYILQLQAGPFTSTQKILLLR